MQPAELKAALEDLDARAQGRSRCVLETPQGVHISIDGRPYLSFASNDYLGLASHPALIEAAIHGLQRWGVGSGASPLVTGHFAIQDQAEQALAAFAECPAALLFGSGYAANLAVIGSLLGRDDAVFADKLNHASLNDGCRLSRAHLCRFRHNDLEHLEYLLRTTPARSRMIVVDAVYSMDGDEAPLAGLLHLAHQYDAWLYVDDAHGFGILGEGHGSLADAGLSDERIIYMATLGKAAGVSGAFVAGTRALIDWLVNTARTYVFSTAHPPMLAQAVLASLTLIASEPWRRERIKQHIACISTLLNDKCLKIKASRTPIQPIIIGDNQRTLDLSERLRAAGLWVPAIRPPTVAAGAARLRISLSAAHSAADLNRLMEGFAGLNA
jgi:8-amino-7-oxononanoate synthase